MLFYLVPVGQGVGELDGGVDFGEEVELGPMVGTGPPVGLGVANTTGATFTL